MVYAAQLALDELCRGRLRVSVRLFSCLRLSGGAGRVAGPGPREGGGAYGLSRIRG